MTHNKGVLGNKQQRNWNNTNISFHKNALQNGALWDDYLVHCGMCELVLLHPSLSCGMQLTLYTNPRMRLFQIPQCSIQNRNVRTSVLNAAMWDVEQVHFGICEIGPLFIYVPGSTAVTIKSPVASGNPLAYLPNHHSAEIVVWNDHGFHC